MKKTYLTIVVLSALTFTSCSRDFLDVKSTSQVVASDIQLYNNNDGAKSLVTSAYNQNLHWNTSAFSWIGMTSIAADEADKGSDPGDTGSDKNLLDALTFNSSMGSLTDTWTGNYQGIGACNQAFDYLPKLDQVDATLKARLLAETHFLRALYYFNLVRCFGGVPIVDHLPVQSSQADLEMQLTRKSVPDVYAFIEKDLTQAIAGLPEKGAYSASDLGRATKGAALALMMKVSLYQKKWAQVVSYGTQISGYTLMPNYQDIFTLAGQNCAESIFEIQSIGGNSDDMNANPGIQQYTQSQAPRGSGGWGWGFCTPSNTLNNAYEAGDKRRAATIMYPGETLYDGKLLPATVSNPMYNYKAYSSAYSDKKFASQTIKVLRYADVLLMLAEAYNEQGNTGQAIALVNQIRTRAGLAPTTAASQSDVRLAIWKERRFELALEHDRWFDIIRTGQAKAAMAADGKDFKVGVNEVYPIPFTFLSQAGQYSSQNPGYN